MYETILPNRVEKRLNRLPGDVYDRVLRILRNLSEDPRPVGSLALKNSEWRRVRVGDYRIIYEVDDDDRKNNHSEDRPPKRRLPLEMTRS